jgi:hypothetical protein
VNAAQTPQIPAPASHQNRQIEASTALGPRLVRFAAEVRTLSRMLGVV